MRRGDHMQTTQRLVFGVVLLGLGVLFLLDRLELADLGDLWSFWPLLLAAVGLVKVLQPVGTPGRGFGVLLLVVGAWWTLENLELVSYSVWDFWPVLLILAGLGLLWRGFRWGFPKTQDQPLAPPPLGEPLTIEQAAPVERAHPGIDSEDSTVHLVALLGGVVRKCSSKAFVGGEVTAVMGGCELDLRQAETATGRAVINVFALWGGIEIHVPPHWAVAAEGLPIMASIEDTRTPSGVPPRSTLVVRGAAIMAGVEIKN